MPTYLYIILFLAWLAWFSAFLFRKRASGARQMHPIPPRQELLFQIDIRLFQAANCGYAQALHQPILCGREPTLDAALGLPTVPRNPSDLQLRQGAPDLGRW